MVNDISRLEALRQGIEHSRDDGYVTIRVADLRWLLEQAGGLRREAEDDDQVARSERIKPLSTLQVSTAAAQSDS